MVPFFMRKKSCQKDWPRVPERFEGIQVNGCGAPDCENFGLSPVPEERICKESNRETNDRQIPEIPEPFRIQGTGLNLASLTCKSCEARKQSGEYSGSITSALKSNQAVAQELHRISRYLSGPDLNCPNGCTHHGEGIKRRGKTASGSQRYQCLSCGKTFTPKKRNRTHRKPETNKFFFKLLVNRTPLRRISEIQSIHPKTVYGKINFLHRQCLDFASRREADLKKMDIHRLYLATDRQVQISNWTQRKDKRNCEIYGIATACLRTGYVFAFNFNFDASVDQELIEKHAIEIGDYDRPKHHREYARLWLKQEFADASKRSSRRAEQLAAGSLAEEVQRKAAFDSTVNVSGSSEDFDSTTRLPAKGVLIHNEYTMTAHFFLLKELLGSVGRTRFYMDQDSGMRGAYLSAFRDKILNGESDGFLIRASKDKTVDAKRQLIRDSQELISEYAGVSVQKMSRKERKEVIKQMLIDRIQKPLPFPKSPEKWVQHPEATMAESEKMIAAITHIDRYSLDHQASLLQMGSLHAVDRFFMQIRRAMSCFERPFGSGTSGRRIWHGYSPYNPDRYSQLGDIYRVYYNYCKTNKEGKTPAMRLGLAKGPVDLEKIIYLDKYTKARS
jgi:transposase-like protein